MNFSSILAAAAAFALTTEPDAVIFERDGKVWISETVMHSAFGLAVYSRTAERARHRGLLFRVMDKVLAADAVTAAEDLVRTAARPTERRQARKARDLAAAMATAA